MLKIYINNEEVIANQNFTIQKHMLNTPSVILNNVCPKTWCDSKDYITNFYHPLDYSKCKIVDETLHPVDPGITTTINEFATLNNVDTTKEYELIQIDGNTTQASTPTPTSPQPINVVSGRQEVDIAGKNLFTTGTGTSTRVGVEATYNGSEIILNGTTNSSGNIFYDETLSINTDYRKSQVLKAGTYTLTTKTTGTATYPSGVGIAFYIRDNNSNVLKAISSINNYQTTLTLENDTQIYSQFYCNGAGAVYDNYTLQVQIEKGTIPSQYEAYKGQTYEINLGKNLLNITNGTYDNNGVIAVVNNGEITLNGTATTSTSFIIIPLLTEIYLGNANKTLSLNNSQTISDTSTECRLYTSGQDYNSVNFSTTNKSTTFSNDRVYTRLQIRTSVGVSYNDFVIKPMLEKGSEATSYSAYKTPIELCKIGTYQDKIYKENGTWYLHKEIGKYTFGSTNLAYDSTYNRAYTNVGGIIDNISIPSSNNEVLKGLCNYLSIVNATTFLGNTSLNGLAVSSNGTLSLRNTSMTTQAQYNTWLSTYKPILYYVLATPTTTEITDTELIDQLETIQLLNGLNNISITSGDLPGAITINYNHVPAYTSEDLLFCGVVKNSGNISLNPREPHYSTLQVLDFKDFLSSGETLDFVIYQKTILEAIQQVIGTIQDYGFILGNVNILNPNEIIGAYSTKDKTAYDVFNYIADITQSRWTTRLIDENTVAIDFYDPTLMPQGTQIDYTNAYFNDKLIDDMKYSYGTNNYRNKQVMVSNQVYSNISQTQSIVANGYQTQFPTEQPIGKINSITSNGIPLTFATFNERDMGYVADFYYNPGDNYFESDDLRSTGEILIIDYVAIVEGRQVITNASEIDRIKESTGRKGIIARYETRNDATTSTELQKIGESYIKYKGTPEIILTIQSRKNTWEVGQRVQFNAPIDELETEYMVRSKKINYIANQQENESQLFYTYELVSSFNSETEINYFDNQRAKSTGNIGEGEYISRNIDIESLAEIIFYDTETTEVQVSGDNELNAILNSPFTS